MDTPTPREPYPTDVTDKEWAFVAPYLTLMGPDASERRHDLREVFNALRWIVWTGDLWRDLPTNLPPWPLVYHQTQRWIENGCFDAQVVDGHTLCSTPESGHRAGYDGHKRTKGSKVHAAFDTLGHLLAVRVTPRTNGSGRRWLTWSQRSWRRAGETVELAYVDQG